MRHPRRLFAFRLAALLGWLDVDRMMSLVPPRLLDEWQGYLMLEPRGAEDDERRAILTGMLASGRDAKAWLHRLPRGVVCAKPQSRSDMDAALNRL